MNVSTENKRFSFSFQNSKKNQLTEKLIALIINFNFAIYINISRNENLKIDVNTYTVLVDNERPLQRSNEFNAFFIITQF